MVSAIDSRSAMLNKTIGKHYLTTTFIVMAFVFLGFQTQRWIARLSASPIEDHHSVFYAKVIDHLNPTDRGKGLTQMLEWNRSGLPLRFMILDEHGSTLFPPNQPTTFDWNALSKPEHPYEFKTMIDPKNPGRAGMHTLIRFSGNPPEYLYVSYERVRGRNSTAFFSAFGFIVVSVLLGIALSMLLLFHSLKNKIHLADSVIASLQRGNLKARFPIHKMDEIGQAMSRFNRMADEIERLVEQVRSAERSRMALLQELAHDLRTPVASLKTMLETLQSKGATLDTKIRDEFQSLALKEVDYFERLVEDLLVLAQVSEPRYQGEQKQVSLNRLLEEESEKYLLQYRAEGSKVTLVKDLLAEELFVSGDPHLLRRMLRNVLNNAFSFADKQVKIVLTKNESNEAMVLIEDDGVGFSDEALASYGVRRVTRVLDQTRGERLSVGLGSVIIKEVAHVHRGHVLAKNRTVNGKTTGASVALCLPLAQSSTSPQNA